ncbi:MAG: aminotransferase class V-fold PLP-dependent enzyme [Bacteroidia bacterium]|nr:aminotransferase class V-fold PLP-dependent enzyme [Bacteroidia bacterium]
MHDTLSHFNTLVQELIEDEVVNPVAQHLPSDELFDTLDLDLSEDGVDNQTFRALFKDLVFRTTRTATKGFFNQLFGGRNEKAVLGDLMATVLNNSMYTYKAAGPMIGVEKVIVEKLCNYVGWDRESGGTIATGGSLANFMGLLMARDSAGTKIQTQGVRAKMTVYTSAESHYSVSKNASFSGIGRENVRKIKADDLGRMRVDLLEEAIKEDVENGFTPVLVNATAGTTVLGAFDPIDAISKICKQHDVWLHVDGAYCGSVLLSKTHKHLINGIEHVDSFSFNAHKMLNVPLTCSILLVKNASHLHQSFSNEAEYLYQTDHDEFNLGKTSLQCGKRNDALKFWTLWKQVGTNGLEKQVDKQFELADTAFRYVSNNPDYTVYSFKNSISICFNYKSIPARQLCTLLYEHSTLLVGYGSFRDEEFIRLVTMNPQHNTDDILNFFRTLEAFVEEHASLFEASV